MKPAVNLPSRGSKVFVGLSGGVDSAVTAALLQKAGLDVTGVFIKGWYPPDMPCTWREDRRDAMRVAAHLGLHFVTLDAADAYKRGVIYYLLAEYKAGRTPNPDIMCNREVKFGAFYAFAKEQGADVIATGHYARAERALEGVRLLRGVDTDKDQSYFLWAVPKAALADTYFPLGSMHKPDVRKLAEQFNLPNARKRDSQGICFLGSISVEDFLAQEFGAEAGEARTADGQLVGQHGGVILFTLGQRVHLENAPPGPWYVISKNMETNVLVVSKQKSTASQSSLILNLTNWFTDPKPKAQYEAQYRYHGPRISGTFDIAHSTFIPEISIPEPVAPGQSLVLYAGDECIGGGIIS